MARYDWRRNPPLFLAFSVQFHEICAFFKFHFWFRVRIPFSSNWLFGSISMGRVSSFSSFLKPWFHLVGRCWFELERCFVGCNCFGWNLSFWLFGARIVGSVNLDFMDEIYFWGKKSRERRTLKANCRFKMGNIEWLGWKIVNKLLCNVCIYH